MFLMPRLDPAGANAPGLRIRDRRRRIRHWGGRGLVVEIMEARLGAAPRVPGPNADFW
jgi:hypothetical protein